MNNAPVRHLVCLAVLVACTDQTPTSATATLLCLAHPTLAFPLLAAEWLTTVDVVTLQWIAAYVVGVGLHLLRESAGFISVALVAAVTLELLFAAVLWSLAMGWPPALLPPLLGRARRREARRLLSGA